jgi:Terminase RNaseH-like domain
VTLTVGVDVGQLADPSAIAVVRLHPQTSRLQTLRLERLPLRQPYPQQARRLASLVANLRRYAISEATSPADRTQPITVLVDVTGIGRATFDLIQEQITTSNVKIKAVTLTSGSDATTHGHELHVPKQDLIDTLRRAMEENRLQVPTDSREYRALTSELRTFLGTKVSPTSTATGAKSGAHDDLVIALSLAVYGANAATRANRVRHSAISGARSASRTTPIPGANLRGGRLVTTPTGEVGWEPR